MFTDPDNEKAVQDVIETIFRVRSLDFRREQQSVPYSTKRYIPDFTFDSLGPAVEVKFCNRAGREKELIDEINADILGYQGTYESMLFVIHDAALFKSDIELRPGVRFLIVKK